MSTAIRPLSRPAEICKALLAAQEASEGRRKKRKRDQTPDVIGLAVRRQLLDRVVQEDPDPQAFEAWLLLYAEKAYGTASSGAVSAMARAVLEDWHLAHNLHDFAAWLAQGAPSADADADE